ncbi:hypothetical protein CKAH01_10665 [Colletotrichum kahawae]|uniref:Hydrophobin n=1 Tax=Colletotrichum kahawae TaxID=34407 RepID=A0AAE0CXG6_COLKA|nr:hypothetical protein CKAH01_10665 [Colletotrichum kahawae]
MKSTAIFFAALAAFAIAAPAGNKVPRQTGESSSEPDVCDGDSGAALCTLGTPLCCRTDVDGLTSMDCVPPTSNLTNVPDTSSLTALNTACLIHGSRRPRCCTLNVVRILAQSTGQTNAY